jgi:hypothetical protein
MIVAAGCSDGTSVVVPGDGPVAPQNLDGFYYAGAVTLTWELGSGWLGETFRVYGKRTSDPDHFLIADVTSCVEGYCTYTDINILSGYTYNYYVAAVNPDTGFETASEWSVDVFVPAPNPPPVPSAMEAVALDNALYLRWADDARAAEDFSFYRVYMQGDGVDYFLGETDSEGFLDKLVANGETYTYYVTSVDDQGHESGASRTASGTPRPDYDNEWIYVYQDFPALSGFVFQEREDLDPLVDGNSPFRHFRLEADAFGWWLVPGPGAEIHQNAFETTALKCGPAADFDCVDLSVAPLGGYTGFAIGVAPQLSYVLRYAASGGGVRYGVIRVEMLGVDQNGYGIMIFDWAHQLQPNNPNLSTIADRP